MRVRRLFIVCAVVSCLGFCTQETEAALAKALGGSGLSGKLSKNKAIRQQQLICDPDDPDTGSTSVRYDPNTVSINSFIFGPGYAGEAFVEVTGAEGRPLLQDFGSFVESPLGKETGYVQVRYFTPGTSSLSGPVVAAAPGVHGQIPVPAGFTTIDVKGPAGVDTHAFLFDYLDTVPDFQVAVYQVYADLGNRPSGNTRDFMAGLDDMGQPFTVDAPDITGVTVRGSLDSVPLPPAVFAGGLMLVGMAGFQLLRRRQLAMAAR